MDINKYILFADVAATKNFTKSGERMGYTQPGVSHVLKAMERELGFPLFLRTPKGVTLTSNAETILPLVRELLAVNEQLTQTVSNINGLETGHLCIATFASISRSWLPQVIFAFKQKYPGIEIELLEAARMILSGGSRTVRRILDCSAKSMPVLCAGRRFMRMHLWRSCQRIIRSMAGRRSR